MSIPRGGKADAFDDGLRFTTSTARSGHELGLSRSPSFWRRAELKQTLRYAIAGLFVGLAAVAPAHAGLPRGAVLTADEQDADPETGVTIARGNAEIRFDKQPISGRADSIELNPASNQILFKGRAVLNVGREHYESDAVTCGLDFSKCTSGASPAVVQPLPPVPSADAAAISPR